jgi:hypothetical protein
VLFAANTPSTYALGIGILGFLLAATCCALGRGAAALLKMPLTIEARFLIGFVVCAYVLALPVYAPIFSIWFAALFVMILAGCAAYLATRPQFATPAAPDTSSDDASVIIILFAIFGIALIWSLEDSYRYWSNNAINFQTTGILRLWVDYFYHASLISSIGDPLSIGRGDPDLADVPVRFYHFASYTFPALAVRTVGMPALLSVTSIWLPWGIFLTVLGVFAAARALSGFIGGAIATIIFALVPDTASYGLKLGFLSFHWMIDTNPGNLFGLPCACASLALLVSWCRGADKRALIGSAILLCAIFLLRAHIFIWFAPAWLAAVIAGAPGYSVRQKTIVFVCLAVAGLATVLLYSAQEISQKGLQPYVYQYFNFLLASDQPPAYGGLYIWLLAKLGFGFGAIALLCLVYFGMGGIPLLTFFAGSGIVASYRKLEAIDILPFTLLAWAGVMSLFAPTTGWWSDITELRQRAFVLVVVVLYCWNAKWLGLWLSRYDFRRLTAVAACAALPITVFYVADWKAPKCSWMIPYVNTQMPLPMLAAANWLHSVGRPGDTFATANVNPNDTFTDVEAQMVGVSGMPGWVAMPKFEAGGGVERAAIVQQRINVLARAAVMANEGDLEQLMRDAHVSYYIVSTPGQPAWDPAHTHAAFRANDVAVYHIPSTATGG